MIFCHGALVACVFVYFAVLSCLFVWLVIMRVFGLTTLLGEIKLRKTA